MKKYVGICVLAVVLLAQSCAKKDGVPSFLSGQYIFTADYTIDQMEGTLSFSKTGMESCELTFLAPDTVAGMTLTLQAGVVITTYKGISAEMSVGDMTRGNPVVTIFNLVSVANADTAKVYDAKNGDITYAYEDGSVIVVANGIPKKIDIPTAGIYLKITGFEAIQSAS